MIEQGDIWWGDLGTPVGSAPGYHRPLLIIQADRFNRSRIDTVLCLPLTSNLAHRAFPVTMILPATATGLPRDSIVNATQSATVDRRQLHDRVGRIERRLLDQVLDLMIELIGR